MKPAINHLITIAGLAALFLAAGCGGKKEKKGEGKIFPALSYIRSQAAMIDTSLFSIRVITSRDSLAADTLHIPREEFRDAAADFLSLPDISTAAYSRRYTEESSYDDALNRVMFISTPANAEKELIQRQEVLIRPDQASGDKVTSIFIKTFLSTKDSSVQKMLLWKVDQSFQITTIKQLPGQPETTTVKKVVWNEEEQE
ncbi:MAG TPA: hypothetical protein PKC69_01150 [Chitinophagaceae bacterium]|nr:hypothetical protein [Chitinophagaceae bacterium]